MNSNNYGREVVKVQTRPPAGTTANPPALLQHGKIDMLIFSQTEPVPPMSQQLLVIEDNRDTCESLCRHYSSRGWQVFSCHTLEEAKQTLQQDRCQPQVVIADLGLPDGSLLDNMEDIQSRHPRAEWIFVLDDPEGCDSSRLDDLAFDMLETPLNRNRLDVIVNRALRSSKVRWQLHQAANAGRQRYQVDAYMGDSDAVRQLKGMMKQLAEVPLSTMVIGGETGTGKGLVARIIHHSGLRSDGPIIELNCAALPRELLESQLFGHEPGAFTGARQRHHGLFEQASGGTLFLDEIGDLDMELQAKLLKAIEDKRIRRLGGEREISIDVQIIAATGTRLDEAVLQGEFREDLFHRLNVFSLTLPPLRERKDDLIQLVPHFIAEYNQKANKQVNTVPDTVWEKLMHYDWPGNVRELRNVIERCVLLSRDHTLPAEWLQLSYQLQLDNETQTGGERMTLPLDGSMTLDEMESCIIRNALEMCDHNVSQTAEFLGTTRETLRYRIQKYQLQ